MASLRYENEKINGVPIPDDGVSFSTVSASGITPYIKLNNVIFSANYGYDTVTITLKNVGTPLFSKPTPTTLGTQEFTFRGRTWKVIDTIEGAKFKISGVSRFNTWGFTGVDLNNPVLKV